MKVLKYVKIDFSRSKAIILLMLYMGLMSCTFGEVYEGVLGTLIYMVFASVIMAGSLFSYSQKAETGFVNMLPGSDLERSAGRFVSGVLTLIYAIAVCLIVWVIRTIPGRMEGVMVHDNYLLESIICALGIGMIIIAIQNVVFYTIGLGNSPQWMAFVHVIPGCIIFGLGSMFYILTLTGREDSVEAIWIGNNRLLLSMGILLVGILFTVAGTFISAKIISKKDFV